MNIHEHQAKEILKDIRSKGTVASLSGVSAIGGVLGVSKFSMSGSFTNNQTAIFTLEGSTFTYTAGGNETAAQARDRLLTNPGTGEFQGADGEIFEFKNVFMKLDSEVLEVVFEDLENPNGSYDFLINTNNTFPYKKCNSAPASVILLFGEVLSYMNSKASLSCSNFVSNKANCFEDMFNYLDVSGNKALSNAEINRASKLLIFFSTVNGQEFNEAGVFGVMSSYAITPLLTKVILNNFDFDNSEDLKLEELLQDREELFDMWIGMAAANLVDSIFDDD